MDTKPVPFVILRWTTLGLRLPRWLHTDNDLGRRVSHVGNANANAMDTGRATPVPGEFCRKYVCFSALLPPNVLFERQDDFHMETCISFG